jgi:hypothetical protein
MTDVLGGREAAVVAQAVSTNAEPNTDAKASRVPSPFEMDGNFMLSVSGQGL